VADKYFEKKFSHTFVSHPSAPRHRRK